jgi:hypothetical protein
MAKADKITRTEVYACIDGPFVGQEKRTNGDSVWQRYDAEGGGYHLYAIRRVNGVVVLKHCGSARPPEPATDQGVLL